MSTPTRYFQDLNVGDMPPTTRSHTQSQQQMAGRNAGTRGRSRISTQTALLPGTPVYGHSGLIYDTQNLSPGSSVRAAEGLVSEFFVDHLQRHGSGGGAYYAFQLKKPISVRIRSPASAVNRVECTCDDHQQTHSACVHIYWLFDGLSAVLTDQTAASIRSLAPGDVISQISELYDLIGDRLASLPEQLNATDEDETEQDSDGSFGTESDASSNLDARKENIRDMLSVFDRTALPQEYGREFDDAPATTSLENVFVPGSLSATVYGLAVRDDTFYKCFRKIVTRDRCASYYFSKQRSRAGEALRELARYVRDGPSRAPIPRDMNIPECARTLRIIIHQICQDRDSRTSKQPLGAAVISKVAEILVEILQKVCNSDVDIHEDITWERDEDDAEPERNGNLYTYLIGDPPKNPSAPAWMNDDFVIDQLLNFPPNEWMHLLERLTTIHEQVQEKALENELPSIGYAAKLQAMLQEYTDIAFEPSSSSAQRRPTIGSPRESQRRRME